MCFLHCKGQMSDSKVITLTAQLQSSLSVQIEENNVQFCFETDKDYKDGVGNGGSINSCRGSVCSTANWKLVLKARGDLLHDNGINRILLNNIGVRAKYLGSTNVINNAEKVPLALSSTGVELLGFDGLHSNANGNEENPFMLYWEMGTRRGNMNRKSVGQQNLKKGKYSTQVEVIVAEVIK